MKPYAYMAVVAFATAGCSYHSDTTVQKPTPVTTSYVVPASPPPPSVVYVPAE